MGRQRLAMLLLIFITTTPVAAAPAEEGDDAGATLAAAEQKLAAGDPDGAIALYERALAQIPGDPGFAPARAEILLTIVEAHEAGFARDHDLDRLLAAKGLLDRYLGPLELLDEQGRAAAEDRRVRLIDHISAVVQARRAEAEARVAAARRERAGVARRRGRSFTVIGATLTGLGAAGVVILATGLGLGRATDERLAALKAEKKAAGDDWDQPCVDDGCAEARRAELDPLLARGSASNTLVIVGAATGAALLASGVTLLVLGRKQLREARALEVAPSGGPTGFGLVLQGRF